MAIVPPEDWVIAEMITHDHIWRGAGVSCDEAREALLAAWTRHRQGVVSALPAYAERLPEAAQMSSHFKIRYLVFQRGGGYRDLERLS